MTRVALDTNIAAYLAGVRRRPDDIAKVERVRGLIDALSGRSTLVAPVQALGELFVVLCRTGASAEQARQVLLEYSQVFVTSGSEVATAVAAADLAVDHKLQFWDALIVTAAADAGCTLLLSEDMQHGFVWRGLTIVNPLSETAHPKLATLLAT